MPGSTSPVAAGLIALLAAGALPARAGDLGADFLSCVQIRKGAQRLACYDRVAATASALPDEEKAEFIPGRPLHVARPSIAPAVATVALESLSATADGKPIFRLVNGQVWQSEDDDAVYPDASGNVVTISRSTLGLGYRLRLNQQTREIVVKRVE